MNKEKLFRKLEFAKVNFPDFLFLMVVLILTPFFVFPRSSLTWLFLIVPLVLIWKWRRKKWFLPRTILDWAIAGLIIQMFVICFVVIDLDFSLAKIAGALYGILLFYALVGVIDSVRERLNSARIIKFFVLIFVFGAALLTVLSFLGMKFTQEAIVRESFSGIERMMLSWRKVAPIINLNLPGAEEGFNANAVAGTALLSLPLILLSAVFFLGERRSTQDGGEQGKGGLGKVLKLGLLVFVWIIFLVIIFLTQSIGSWLALLVALWLIGMGRHWDKKWLIIATLCVLIFISLTGGGEEENHVNWVKKKWETRKPLLLIGLGVIKERPLTGLGMNQLRKLTMIEYGRSHAHNHFIHTAAELGLPALVAYLAILLGAGFMCVEVWRKGKDEFMRMSVLGLGAGQLAHFIFGLGDSIPLGAKTNFIFWVSLALITAIYNYTFRFNT